MPPAMPLLADYQQHWQELVAPRPPPPSTPLRCESWCDPTWPVQHCADQRCSMCGFCRARVGCRSDSCRAESAVAHCLQGDCMSCAFCATVCPKWCQARYAASHCTTPNVPTTQMSCAKCEFCQARQQQQQQPLALGAGPQLTPATCANWCRQRNAEVHCLESQCAGCSYCVIAAASPPLPLSITATVMHANAPPPPLPPTASCLSWCLARYAGDHCPQLSCAACAFCHDDSTSPTASAILPPPPPPPVASCLPWCREQYAKDHCSYWPCQGCDFCLPERSSDSPALPPAAKGHGWWLEGGARPPPPSPPRLSSVMTTIAAAAVSTQKSSKAWKHLPQPPPPAQQQQQQQLFLHPPPAIVTPLLVLILLRRPCQHTAVYTHRHPRCLRSIRLLRRLRRALSLCRSRRACSSSASLRPP